MYKFPKLKKKVQRCTTVLIKDISRGYETVDLFQEGLVYSMQHLYRQNNTSFNQEEKRGALLWAIPDGW